MKVIILNKEVFLKRHEEKYNSYFNEIVKQQEMLKRIPDSIENDSNSTSINEEIIYKRLFAFVLSYNQEAVGFLCIDNIDWENRNCRLKGGIIEKYSASINPDMLKPCLVEALSFCYNFLNMRRVWGMMESDNSYTAEVIDEIFLREGVTIENDIIYFGNVNGSHI